jgi:hypothetical protein
MPEPSRSPGSTSTRWSTTFSIPVREGAEPTPASEVGVGRPRFLTYAAAAGFFLLAFVGAFHSIALHPESRVLNGFGFSDAVGGLRNYWAMSYQHQNPLTFKHDALSGAPQGDAASPVVTLTSGGLQTAFVWAAHDVLGWVGAWNLYFLLTVLGSSLAMFAFLDWLGCTFVAALFGGYVFGFNAYALERAYAGHLGLLANWVFVLLLWVLLWSRRRSLLPSALAIGGTIALAFCSSAYLGLFSAFTALVYFAVAVATGGDSRDRVRVVKVAISSYFVTLLALTPVLVLYERERSAVQASVGHSLAQVYAYSIPGLRYLRPSPRNPLFRWLTGEHESRYLVEHTVFFGFTTIALAVIGTVLLFRGDTWLNGQGRRRRAGVFAAALAPAAFLMSLGPKVHLGSVQVAMPSWLLVHVTTFWRVYARFGLLVGFALAIAAALALTAISKRPGRVWSVLPWVALGAVVLELLPGNVGALDTNARPKWVQWLEAHPGGTVASYPFFVGQAGAADLINSDYWYQVFDHHPRFQSISPDLNSRRDAIRLIAQDVTQPTSARVLATEGVRYAVLHDDVYRVDGKGRRPPTPYPDYFKLLVRFGNTWIYSVQAPHLSIRRAIAAHPVEIGRSQGQTGAGVLTGDGFNTPELYHHVASAWMIQGGILQLVNSDARKRVRLTGIAFSNKLPRLLVLTDESGVVIGRQVIPTSEVKLRFPSFDIPHGTTILRLSAYPGPRTIGPYDSRSASVFVSGLTAYPLPVWMIGWPPR